MIRLGRDVAEMFRDEGIHLRGQVGVVAAADEQIRHIALRRAMFAGPLIHRESRDPQRGQKLSLAGRGGLGECTSVGMIHARNMVCRFGSVNTEMDCGVNPLKMTPAERFGRRLRQLRREKSAREERDVEQAEVAQAAKDTQPNVARYERGRIPRDESVTKRLAAFYDVNWIWLLHGEGDKHLPSTTEEFQPRPESIPTARAAVAGARKRPRKR